MRSSLCPVNPSRYYFLHCQNDQNFINPYSGRTGQKIAIKAALTAFSLSLKILKKFTVIYVTEFDVLEFSRNFPSSGTEEIAQNNVPIHIIQLLILNH